MKKYKITKFQAVEVEIGESDFQLFMELIKFNDNIYECEIFTNCGWKYVAEHLQDFTNKNVGWLMFDNELDQALENFFAVHLFGPLQNIEPFSAN